MEDDKAKKFYEKHLKRVSEYQKAHPDKCHEKCKKYNDKMKLEHPEKYAAMLEKKRRYYLEVRKPKIEADKSILTRK